MRGRILGFAGRIWLVCQTFLVPVRAVKRWMPAGAGMGVEFWMRANSLALRLFVSATAWTVLILVATGFVLSSLSRQAVERAFDRRLGVYLKTLIADVASPEIPNEKAGQTIGEPMFDLPLS